VALKDEMDAGNGAAPSIYEALNPSERQIRLLELYPGTEDAPVEGRLIISSIPTVTQIADAYMDAAEELSLQKAYLKDLSSNSQKIKELKTLIEAQDAAVLKESNSIKLQYSTANMEQFTADGVNDLNSRICNLQTSSKRLNRSKHELEQFMERQNALAIKVGDSWKTSADRSYELVDEDRRSYIDPSGSVQHSIATVPYDAISYCWNDGTSKADMFLNDLLFKAPSSAVEVLRKVRSTNCNRVLWIDAICINQCDYDERGQQVTMMGDIYLNSASTIVWLGPSLDEAETQHAFQLCSTVAEQILQGRDIHQLPEIDTLASTCRSISIPLEQSLTLLNTVFSRRWFTRLWVWQEVALPPVAVCQIGGYTIPWREIMLTAFWWNEVMDQFNDLPPESLPDEQTQWNMHFPATIFMIANDSDQQEPFAGLHLSQIVYQSRHGEATDPRDKIYGLLGMTRWSKSGRRLPPGLRPNYNESVRNCMRDATRAMLVEDEDLGVLSNELLDVERGAGSEYETWPSWTPIWCVIDDLQGERKLQNIYQADNGQELSVDRLTNCADPDVLTLDGYEVDEVATTILVPGNYFADSENLLADIRTLQSPAGSGTSISLERLFLTLLVDEHEGNRNVIDIPVIQSLLDNLNSAAGLSTAADGNQSSVRSWSEITMHLPPEELDIIMSDLRGNARGRQLFTTTHGRIGIGPNCTKEHDEIVVLFGGPWPFVIRKQESHHILIGHSFVHGIMDGEFVREMEAEGIPARTFEIH
jgi:hypothetical protein